MKLLCFPYAGGSSVKFLSWKKYLDGIEIIPLDPPGRGRRMTEPLCETLNEMVNDVKEQLLSLITRGEQYAIYGHSMGTLLVYELLHDLLEDGFHMPAHLFLSGKNPPHYLAEKPIYQFDDEMFIEELVKMAGGISVFEDPMMKKMYLPIFRTDFRIVETYRYKEKKQPLPVDATFLYGLFDGVISNEQTQQWADYTTGTFQTLYLPGGHFFFFGQEEKVAGIIRKTLLQENEDVPY
jgi:surfactin synthase thioesterase subunit